MNRWILILICTNVMSLAAVGYLLAASGKTIRLKTASKTGETSYQKVEVKHTITKNTAALNKCYTEYLSKSPVKKVGSLKMDWLIDSSGIPQKVEKINDDLADAELTECARAVVIDMRFPPHSQESPIYVIHQFNFGAAPKREAPRMVNVSR